jgi:hypothetical protein
MTPWLALPEMTLAAAGTAPPDRVARAFGDKDAVEVPEVVWGDLPVRVRAYKVSLNGVVVRPGAEQGDPDAAVAGDDVARAGRRPADGVAGGQD